MTGVDLLNMIGKDTQLKRVASTNGGEYAGACPFCGGHDRFRVWPEADRPSWWCRRCQRGGDIVAYMVECGELTSQEAGRLRHSGSPGDAFAKRAKVRSMVSTSEGPPSMIWQSRGRQFVVYCQDCLWNGIGDRALAWLRARGLSDDNIRYFGLGYNPADLRDEPHRWGLDGEKKIWLPRGVIIPCKVAGVLWYVKIRRPAGKPKYAQPRGSKAALFGADDLGNGNRLLLLCEGEFDTMLAKQEVGDLVDVASFAGAGKGIPTRWLPYLIPHMRLLVAYDGDKAGRLGADKLVSLSRRMVKIDVVDGDLTDFFTAGGDLRGWLAGEIARHTPEPLRMDLVGGDVYQVEA